MADNASAPKSEGLKEIPASEILAKIKKGEPVEYDNVTISGDLDISKLDLPKDENGRATVTSNLDSVALTPH